jgi:hypothetical protein
VSSIVLSFALIEWLGGSKYRTSSSYCEICRRTCANGKVRSGAKGMSERLIGIVRCYGMEMSVGKELK